MPATLDEARAAKSRLARSLSHPAVNGIGIAPCDGGYVVKVNLLEPVARGTVPEDVGGVAVRTQVVGPITAQPAAR